nr:EOG090X07PL [Eulimnadia texana]
METSRVSTYLLEFHLAESLDKDSVVSTLLALLEKHFESCQQLLRDDSLVLAQLPNKSFTTLQFKSPRLLLQNIDLMTTCQEADVRKYFDEVCETLNCSPSKFIPPIHRGGELDSCRYLTSSDGRILEYDVDKVVVDVKSKYQRIQILHTVSFGNLLVLDDLQNLAESDLIYTESLMHRGKIDYSGKDVLILGGGDGALLWELLQEKPNMVTMVEIDETVIQSCRQHLRAACGSALDSYEGPNHKIIIGDCMEQLNNFQSNGVKFDFVFADLTDIPLAPEPQNEEWQFLQNVLIISLGLLKDSGRFLTHGSGVSSVASLKLFEEFLGEVKPLVEFERSKAYVPSFMEEWVFYQVWKRS